MRQSTIDRCLAQAERLGYCAEVTRGGSCTASVYIHVFDEERDLSIDLRLSNHDPNLNNGQCCFEIGDYQDAEFRTTAQFFKWWSEVAIVVMIIRDIANGSGC